MTRLNGVVLAVLTIAVFLTASLVQISPSSSPDLLLRQVVAVSCEVEHDGRLGLTKGSAIVIDASRALLLTNAHVVKDCRDAIWAADYDNNRVPSSVFAMDEEVDIAVLALAPGLDIEDARPGDPNGLLPGTTAWVVGNSKGKGLAIHRGIISQINRTEQGTISTDAAINPGNSGGALFDNDLKLVGVVTLKEQAEGIGYAIPVDQALKFYSDLLERGAVRQAVFGVELASESAGLPYPVRVEGAVPGSPAAVAGIRAGDRLVLVDGVAAESTKQVEGALKRCVGGEKVSWRVARDGRLFDIEIAPVE